VNDHPLTVEARSIRELFHQATETDISFTPSVLCSEVLEYQRISQKFLKVNHQLNLAQLEINQIRSTHELLEQHVNDLQHRLHTQEKAQAALEEKNTQIEESFSLRLGLALTWPVRKLRSANRKR
jgi:DNA gyrase/topoisomerase IV subunit A